ncbi:TerD family protein [Streptacidiphilus cavernicola]|uniref:Tellurium resistance n=1 Tax=Streptacidiphilus cavernicola TaxID=3342716 RepID=A0ABV6VRL0_9ACTN
MAGLRDFLNKSDPLFSASNGRLTLTKGSPSVSLTELGTGAGTLQVNLHWTARQVESMARPPGNGWRGLLRPTLFKPMEMPSSGSQIVAVDLDLGCLYELADGTKGVVQPLGGLFGDLQRAPYIRLSRDDRSGAPSGEMMYIDLAKKEMFKRILIFVYIYDETPAFDRAHAVVTLFLPGGPPIEVKLDERAPQARSCAVALIENRDGNLTVRREAKYVYGFQAELDRLYGFGMQWQRGYKPVSG